MSSWICRTFIRGKAEANSRRFQRSISTAVTGHDPAIVVDDYFHGDDTWDAG
jgi:hypothetical protein